MTKPVIVGLSGYTVTPEEEALFKEHQPAGFILFLRNCKTATQVKSLTTHLQQITHNPNIPVLIDQEGGRVQRLPWRDDPSAACFVKSNDANACYNNAITMASALKELGINVNCTPVLDLTVDGADPIIGDRVFGHCTDSIEFMAKTVIDGHLEAKVLPVIKHIPGHGRATVDSHKALPIVDTPLQELKETDFKPFKRLAKNSPLGMTAHIVYTAIDSKNPATFSKTVIEDIIRDYMGFEGLLMSDDLNMHALSGTMAERAQKCLEAGCDLALHCSGDYNEMAEIFAAISPQIDPFERLSTYW